MDRNLNRASKFLEEIAQDIKEYKAKWRKYFKQIGYTWSDDLLGDTIVKCHDTIERLGLKEGKQESYNYLFKALKMNYLRELEYARNKYRDDVEDINVLYETYMNTKKPSDYKIASDLWLEYQMNYIARNVELNWDKGTAYLFKLKYILQLDDNEIRKKSKNPNWKKDLKELTKWLRLTIDRKEILKDFNSEYPDIDLSILSE